MNEETKSILIKVTPSGDNRRRIYSSIKLWVVNRSWSRIKNASWYVALWDQSNVSFSNSKDSRETGYDTKVLIVFFILQMNS